MGYLNALRSFFFAALFFSMLAAHAQTDESLKKHQNDKYGFSFSYPSAFMLEVVDNDEWIIRKSDGSWALGFKIYHLNGRDYDTYVNSFMYSLFNALAKGYNLSAKISEAPEKKPYSQHQMTGFLFEQYLAGSMGEGNGVEKLFNSWNLYLNIYKKGSLVHFAADGIIVYDFRQPLDNDGHKLTRQVISSFEKTIVFNGVFPEKKPVTTVPVTKPVITKPVVKPVITDPVTKPVTTVTDPAPKVPDAVDYRPKRKKGLYILYSKFGKTGFTNESYELVIDTVYSTHYYVWSEGCAALGKDNLWGFIDTTGKIVVPFIYQESKNFHNEYAAVKLKGRWGFVNSIGEEIIPFLYKDARYFSEGYAAVQIDDYWGFIDLDNAIKIKGPYDYAFDFSDGAAAVETNGKWGYLDKSGNYLFPDRFTKAGFFELGKAKVEKDGIEFYIDKTGKRVD